MASPAPPSAVPNNAVAPSADKQAPPEGEDCASEPPQSSAALGDADQQAPPQSDECAPEDSDPEDDGNSLLLTDIHSIRDIYANA